MYQVNFSSWRTDLQLSRYRFWRNVGLFQGILFAITLAVVQMQSHSRQISQQGSLAALLQQQAALSQQHQQVQQLMVQKQQVEQRVRMHRQMHQSAQRYLVLLQQLSQQIPDNCWLISLIPQNGKLVFEAVSQDYAAIHDFLAKLDRQSLLTNVRLQRIAPRDNGYFQFTAQADWPQKGGSDE